MTAKEYLSQAHLLDQRIDLEIKQAESYRRLAYSLGSPNPGERVQTSRKNDATFAHTLDKVLDMEVEINRKIDLLVALKEQIQTVIDSVEDFDERMILRCRYLDGMNWSEIGQIQSINRTTVYRRHNKALAHVILPEDAITV